MHAPTTPSPAFFSTPASHGMRDDAFHADRDRADPGLVRLRRGGADLLQAGRGPRGVRFGGVGVLVYVLEFVLWFSALSRAQLSFAFPFAALTYVGVVLASRLVLRERISLRRWVGIGTIVLGVALVTGQQLG